MVESGKAKLLDTSAKSLGHRRWLLAFLLLLFVLPLMGSSYWMYLQTTKEIEKRELQGDLVRARTLSAMVEKDLTSAETILTSIASRPSLREDWKNRNFAALEQQLQEARN